jgi:multidrug efflux system membrane fusion protein
LEQPAARAHNGEPVIPKERHPLPAPPPVRPSWFRRIVTLLIVAGLGGAGYYSRGAWMPLLTARSGKADGPKGKGARAVPVRASMASRRDFDLYLNGLGTVTAFNTVTLKSRVDGELVDVKFEEGELVKEGQVLAQVDPRPFEVQLQQAEGQLARNEATLKLAETNLARSRELVRKKAITAQEIDTQEATVEQTKAQIKTDEAMVANAKLQLTYCQITAPINGQIGLRRVDEGNIVRANDLLGMAVITQLDPISILFTIPQDDIPRVQRRMSEDKAPKVQAFDRSFRNKLADGKLVAIDNQVDSTTGTLRLKAEFENKSRTLFPNQFVNVRLLVETLQNAIIVPSAAVQRGPERTFVYVVKPDETVDLRYVETGPVEGTETSIKSGLESGEIVVTDGLEKLQPGTKVVVQTAPTRETSAAD